MNYNSTAVILLLLIFIYSFYIIILYPTKWFGYEELITKKIICGIFSRHKRIVRNFYPNDPTTTIECMRCGKIINQFPNPMYYKTWLKKLRQSKIKKINAEKY